MSYRIAGTAGHDHTVAFTPTELKRSTSGQTVVATSSNTSQHQHGVTPCCP